MPNKGEEIIAHRSEARYYYKKAELLQNPHKSRKGQRTIYFFLCLKPDILLIQQLKVPELSHKTVLFIKCPARTLPSG